MRKSQCGDVLWKSLMLLVLAVATADAQDNGGTESTTSITWRTSYRRAVDEANREGKPLLVRVTASWCGPCRQMKQLTFADSRIVELVRSEFVPLSIDADEHPDLVSGFRVEAYPTTLVIAPNLSILKRMAGYKSAGDLLATLTPLAKTHLAIRSTSDSSDAVSALEPVNSVKFGFDGYCLVSLLEDGRLRRGSGEFTAEHRGQTICFETEEHQTRFLLNPERYWPVANGQCLVSSREGSNAGKGDPRMAVTWRGRIFMFSDRNRQRRFIQAPYYYSNEM